MVDLEEAGLEEDELLLMALEAGAEDITTEGSLAEIYTTTESFNEVKNNLEENGINLSAAEISMIPKTTVTIETADKAEKILALVDELEEHDDVQDVFSNYNIPDEIMESLN